MRRVVLVLAVAVLAAAALVTVHRQLPEWYVRALPSWLARSLYPLEHDRLIREAARRNDIDPALVAAVIYAESGFREGAVSERGAVGLMQLLPSTATEIAARTGGERFVIDDLRDPDVNIRYGSHYLASLLDYYDGALVEAVAAYHAGVRTVDGWAAEQGGQVALSEIPFDDTRDYVREVVSLTTLYRRVYAAELETPA